MNDSKLTLYLVRHGETDWNRERRFQGQLDIPLNSAGLRQAEEAASLLKSAQLERLLSSPLLRARQTAQIISQTVGLSVEYAAELVEMHHGAWQGLIHPQAAAEFPREWAAWQEDASDFRIPGGESVAEVFKRVEKLLGRLQTGNICLVTHGVVIKVILAILTGCPVGISGSTRVANGGVQVIRTTESRKLETVTGRHLTRRKVVERLEEGG